MLFGGQGSGFQLINIKSIFDKQKKKSLKSQHDNLQEYLDGHTCFWIETVENYFFYSLLALGVDFWIINWRQLIYHWLTLNCH